MLWAQTPSFFLDMIPRGRQTFLSACCSEKPFVFKLLLWALFLPWSFPAAAILQWGGIAAAAAI